MYTVYIIINILILQVLTMEYNIKDGKIPSFLYKKFDNVIENKFPADIRINMSLSRIPGTLLYSIDSHTNQLIVTLQKGVEETLKIEFNKQTLLLLSLNELCGCKPCRYRVMDLRIRIGENLIISCNDGSARQLEYTSAKELNIDYPNPYSNMQLNYDPSKNEAHLWLVNTQKYGAIYPNNDQLSGCIFNVEYRNEVVKFLNISGKIERKCTKVCKDSICNGGGCIETYAESPRCNCSSTFKNGKYCNDTMTSINAKFYNRAYKFEVMKLSWQSSSYDIFVLQNKQIQLRLFRANKELTFEYSLITARGSTTKSILSKEYIPGLQYLLIGIFQRNQILIKFYYNMTWYETTLLTDRDINDEIFTSVALRSGNQLIDLVYKQVESEYFWTRINMLNSTLLGNETFGDMRKIREQSKAVIISLVLIVVVIILVVSIWTLFVCIRKSKKNPRVPWKRRLMHIQEKERLTKDDGLTDIIRKMKNHPLVKEIQNNCNKIGDKALITDLENVCKHKISLPDESREKLTKFIENEVTMRDYNDEDEIEFLKLRKALDVFSANSPTTI